MPNLESISEAQAHQGIGHGAPLVYGFADRIDFSLHIVLLLVCGV